MDCSLGQFILADFMPHGFCMRWQPEVLWLHVISDGFIVLAYSSIPFLLLVVARRRKDIPFHWMLPAFSAFIFACGATHLMSIVTIWNPLYQLEGILKALTAVASLLTAFGLYRLLPNILKMPSTVQLQNAHASLTLSNCELSQLADELEASNRALQHSAEAHERSEAQFRQLADSMPHIVWTAQPDGLVDYYNERWYSFTGFDRSLFGDSSWMPLLHPEDLQMVRDAWYASVQSGVSFKVEYRFWDRATQTYRWHLGQAVPVIDAQATITKWFGGSTDIDDYKRAENAILTLNSELESRVAQRTQELSRANEALCRTQTWLQAIVHSATDVSIMVLDNDGIITFFNSGSERLLGYQASELVGKCTPYLLYPPVERENRARHLSEELKRPVSVDEIFLAANQLAGSFVLESAYLHKDGTRIDISLAISPMTDSSDERLGKLAIAVDMRPRKALEHQLRLNNAELKQQKQVAEHANRAKSDFLSTMSHEIRTPMNAILGMADLLWDSELLEVQRRYVEVFRRASANLLSLVNDMLDLSKIESGRFELERIEFDLNTVIQTALDITRPSLKSKQLLLNAIVADGTPTGLIGDPLRLQQVLTNLLSNAVKFTDSGSVTLTVRTSSDTPPRIQFAVSDTGIGIPADKLELIFQDFTQAESSTTRRFGGTGLGLGICRRLVHRMGGTIDVRSTPGEGSIFSFEAEFELSHVPESTHLTSESTSLGGKRVLLVDDTSTNRLIFTEMCHVWGMETAECDDAAHVLPQLRAAQMNGKPFDLIIVDMIIRDANGIDLVSNIRQSYPHLPVLMTTSDQIPGDQTRVFSFGEAAYAVKPVRRSELLQLICNLLGSVKQATVSESFSNKRARILIADDSEDNCFLLNEYLKSGPFEIQFAANGQEAVDLAQTQRFDLILMDILMPVMDGLTATRLIRRSEQEAGMQPVPLLALTANARAEDLELSATAGCTGHISKPVSRQLLIERVMDHIHIRPVEISIPQGLEEAAKRYLQSRKNELSTLKQLISQADFDQLRRLAHNMKGTGTSYGFPDLTRIGKLMETAAKAQRAEDLSAQLLELSRYLQDAEAVLTGH